MAKDMFTTFTLIAYKETGEDINGDVTYYSDFKFVNHINLFDLIAELTDLMVRNEQKESYDEDYKFIIIDESTSNQLFNDTGNKNFITNFACSLFLEAEGKKDKIINDLKKKAEQEKQEKLFRINAAKISQYIELQKELKEKGLI